MRDRAHLEREVHLDVFKQGVWSAVAAISATEKQILRMPQRQTEAHGLSVLWGKHASGKLARIHEEVGTQRDGTHSESSGGGRLLSRGLIARELKDRFGKGA